MIEVHALKEKGHISRVFTSRVMQDMRMRVKILSARLCCPRWSLIPSILLKSLRKMPLPATVKTG